MIGDTPTKAQGGPPAALRVSDKPEGAKGRHRTLQGRATARVVFRCEATLYDSIKAVAARNGVNVSEAVRLMLAAYVGDDGGRSSDVARLAKSLRPLSRVGGTTLRPRKAFP
jgi:Ribbon-helix-helix protein, copG family